MEFYLIFICQAVSFLNFSQSFKNIKTILSLQAMQRESGPDLPVSGNADSWSNITLIHKKQFKKMIFLVK